MPIVPRPITATVRREGADEEGEGRDGSGVDIRSIARLQKVFPMREGKTAVGGGPGQGRRLRNSADG
ncbi:hypothetical protein GCM10010507_33960 [Streptomyces cinnamoneus]|uniref:Uncharacterized protein n=1 Tax=Streptomyces cinnamoneus TaxID=53446 RepID=A0A918TQ61_STRCJ|nr:hypothetical protein GCM10010507_33960 [Streptomyces cinnamoneus]